MPVPTAILLKGENAYESVDRKELEALSDLLIASLKEYNINIHVENIKPTPSIIRFEISIERGTQICDITSLKQDLQLLMKMPTIGIEAPIPGTKYIAIDLPNEHTVIPRLRNLLDNESFIKASETAIAIGSNTNNVPILFDVAKQQHLLITGNSIREIEEARNQIAVSMLCKARHQNVKMLIIDTTDKVPNSFDELPHCPMKVGSNHQYAAKVINYAINELDQRIELMEMHSVRTIKNIDPSIPYIMIFINDIDDLLKHEQASIHSNISKLISQGPYAGIHLIISTQINLKSNTFLMLNDRIRNKIVFKVNSIEDSLSVIYHDGAESLMSNGDMYFYERPTNISIRSNSPLVTPIEIYEICDWLIKNES